ncbi:IS110 family transposase, partial [Pseudonocardia yunnanensis]|uniref:IS110 family transposase n=1 Tax=Pseudonocardia yunnanensis TaxID=58107 RepID=UPI0031D8FBE9
IEGAGGLGAPLATRLLADGLEVLDVPAKLAARVRVLSTGHGRKTDEADAVSVGVAAWTAAGLVAVQFDELAMALRALAEHRDDLVKTRTQTVNRLHVLLAHLLPGGAGLGLTADEAAGLLRRVRQRDVLGVTRRRLAIELVGEVRRLDGRIAATGEQIITSVRHRAVRSRGTHGSADTPPDPARHPEPAGRNAWRAAVDGRREAAGARRRTVQGACSRHGAWSLRARRGQPAAGDASKPLDLALGSRARRSVHRLFEVPGGGFVEG